MELNPHCRPRGYPIDSVISYINFERVLMAHLAAQLGKTIAGDRFGWAPLPRGRF